MWPDMVAAAMLRFDHALETRFGQIEFPQIVVCMWARADEWQDPQNHASTERTTVLGQIGIIDSERQFLGLNEIGESVLPDDLVLTG